MRLMKWAAILVTASAVLVTCSPIGEFVSVAVLNATTTTEFRTESDTLYMSGEINAKTLNQFEAIYAQNPQITRVVEQQIGGSLDDETMIRLAYRLRELGLNTHLQADSAIYSGGVDLFLAGVERTMEKGAVIGVHSWSDGIKDAADYPRASPEHEENRKYIEDMLGDDAFYWFTIYAAPAGDIHEMSAQEIAQYGLLTAPMIE